MHHFIDIHLFIRGIFIGFAVAAPVGPIGILCLRRTFHYGRLSGLFSGFGAVTADMIYSTIAIFGLTFVSDIIQHHRKPLHIFGILILVFLGWKIFFDTPHGKNIALVHKGLWRDYFSTFGLTMAQPGAIVALFAIFSGIAPRVAGDAHAALFVLAGTLLGASLSWFLVTHGASHLHKKVSAESFMHWVNRIAGILIWIFAVLLALDFFMGLK